MTAVIVGYVLLLVRPDHVTICDIGRIVNAGTSSTKNHIMLSRSEGATKGGRHGGGGGGGCRRRRGKGRTR